MLTPSTADMMHEGDFGLQKPAGGKWYTPKCLREAEDGSCAVYSKGG